MGNTSNSRLEPKISKEYKIQTVYLQKQLKDFIKHESKKLEVNYCDYLRGLMNKYEHWFDDFPENTPVYINLNVKKSTLKTSKKFFSFSDYLRILLFFEKTQRNLTPVYPLIEDLSKEQIVDLFQTIFHKTTNTNINSPILVECNGLKYQIRNGKFVCVAGEYQNYIPQKREKNEQRMSKLSGEN